MIYRISLEDIRKQIEDVLIYDEWKMTKNDEQIKYLTEKRHYRRGKTREEAHEWAKVRYKVLIDKDSKDKVIFYPERDFILIRNWLKFLYYAINLKFEDGSYDYNNEVLSFYFKKLLMREKSDIEDLFDTPENIMKYPADEFVESFVGLNRIWSSPKYIKVQDFMITEPISVREDVSAYKCIRILRSHHIDTLPVVDSEGTLLGIIGRQSFLNRPLPSSRARDIMYSAQHTVHPDENILDVLTTIRETDVSNLPVIDDNGRIIGLLTSSRLIATMSQQFLDNMSEEEVK